MEPKEPFGIGKNKDSEMTSSKMICLTPLSYVHLV